MMDLFSNEKDEEDWSLHLWQLPLLEEPGLSATYQIAQTRYVNARHGHLGVPRKQELLHYRQYYEKLDGTGAASNSKNSNNNHAALILPAIKQMNTACSSWKSEFTPQALVKALQSSMRNRPPQKQDTEDPSSPATLKSTAEASDSSSTSLAMKAAAIGSSPHRLNEEAGAAQPPREQLLLLAKLYQQEDVPVQERGPHKKLKTSAHGVRGTGENISPRAEQVVVAPDPFTKNTAHKGGDTSLSSDREQVEQSASGLTDTNCKPANYSLGKLSRSSARVDTYPPDDNLHYGGSKSSSSVTQPNAAVGGDQRYFGEQNNMATDGSVNSDRSNNDNFAGNHSSGFNYEKNNEFSNNRGAFPNNNGVRNTNNSTSDSNHDNRHVPFNNESNSFRDNRGNSFKNISGNLFNDGRTNSFDARRTNTCNDSRDDSFGDNKSNSFETNRTNTFNRNRDYVSNPNTNGGNAFNPGSSRLTEKGCPLAPLPAPRGGRGRGGQYPWQRGGGVSQQRDPRGGDFKTASHQLLLNQAKQNGRGGSGFGSGGSSFGSGGNGIGSGGNGIGRCGGGRLQQQGAPDDVGVRAAQYSGGERRSLGARPGSVSSRFVPPVRRDDSGSVSGGGSRECHAGAAAAVNRGDDQPGPWDHLMADHRMKNIDVKMVELIMNEVLDAGLDVAWDDIAGLQEAKATIQEVVVWPMLRPDIFTGLRGPPKGVLLFGPPGTGKTMIGKAIASQSGATFFSISASCLTSKWVGEGEKMVRALFAVARVQSPSVIFIDEIDSLLCQRSESEHESSRRIKTEFLVQLDGVGVVHEQVLVVGATNRPQELDEAARRRLVKRLYIPLPDAQARCQLISKLLTRQRHTLSPADISWVADHTEGYSGADVSAVCSEAAMGPIRGINPADMRHISLEQVRPMSIEDFRSSASTVRPSVCAGDLEQYQQWNDKYGITRAAATATEQPQQ